jgi:hypothetical protein
MKWTPAAISQFQKTARPIMRQWMTADSCIGAVRTVVEVMKLFEIPTKVLPVSYIFEVPARKYARVCGFDAEEREAMRAKVADWRDLPNVGTGWNGHLLVLAADRWLIDPAIDQFDNPEFGVTVPPQIFVVDLDGQDWTPDEQFEMRLGLILDNGDAARLRYWSLKDQAYLQTEAWNDEGLPLLAAVIAEEVKDAINVRRG